MAIVFNTPKSALNTTSGAIQVKNGDNLQTKEITISEEGEFTVKADKGYYGLSQVDISVDVPSDVHNQNVSVSPETTQQVITPEEGYTGLGEVTVGAVTAAIDANIEAGNIKKDVTILGITGNYDPQPDLEAKTVNSSTVQQVVTPTAGKDGLSSVTVEPYVLQAKTAAPSTSQQVIEPDNDKDGLSSVTISAVTSSIDANISAGNIKKDVTILGVTGNFDPTPNLSNLNITPSTNAQEYNPAISGVDGYNIVSVAAVTAAIDSNIQAANILSGVTILGVAGSDAGYQAGYSAGETDGYNMGYTDGQASCVPCDPCPDPPVLTSLSITPSTSAQTFSPDPEDGWDYVSVSAVTSAIDNNIQAGNIKSGVTILGVQGTVNEGINPSGNINITDTQSTNVTNYATAQVVDANLVASNIKDGVSILGVTGEVVEANLELNTEFYSPISGKYVVTPQSGYNGFDEVKVTVEPDPMGSFWTPFDASDNHTMGLVYTRLDEGGYFDGLVAHFSMEVASGSIDSETGCYVAEDAFGNSFTILPYYDNPDYDPENPDPNVPDFIFPANFDLSGLVIQVNADVETNVSITENQPEDPMLGPTYTIEISECDLEGINFNGDMDTWEQCYFPGL